MHTDASHASLKLLTFNLTFVSMFFTSPSSVYYFNWNQFSLNRMQHYFPCLKVEQNVIAESLAVLSFSLYLDLLRKLYLGIPHVSVQTARVSIIPESESRNPTALFFRVISPVVCDDVTCWCKWWHFLPWATSHSSSSVEEGKPVDEFSV